MGDKTFSYNFDQNTVEETPSTLHFNGKFRVREANSEELKLGCEVILELDAPLETMLPATTKFGRKAIHRDISNYKPPVFDERQYG